MSGRCVSPFLLRGAARGEGTSRGEGAEGLPQPLYHFNSLLPVVTRFIFSQKPSLTFYLG